MLRKSLIDDDYFDRDEPKSPTEEKVQQPTIEPAATNKVQLENTEYVSSESEEEVLEHNALPAAEPVPTIAYQKQQNMDFMQSIELTPPTKSTETTEATFTKRQQQQQVYSAAGLTCLSLVTSLAVLVISLREIIVA